MTSFFRRAGAVLATFIKTAADPAAVTDQYLLYSKDDAYGNTQIFGRPDVGAILQLTPGEVIRYAGNPNGALSAAIYSLSINPATGIRYVNTDGAVAWSVWAAGSFVGTEGSIPFVSPTGVLTQDNANLFWADAGNRLGVGTNTPGEFAGGDLSAQPDTIAHFTRSGSALNTFVLIAGGTAMDSGISLFTETVGQDSSIWLDHSDARKLKISMGLVSANADREASTKVTIDQGGKVGIGVTAPLYIFHVVGSVAAEATCRIAHTDTTGYPSFEFVNAASAFVGAVGHGNSAAAVTHLRNVNYLYAPTTSNWVIANPTAVAMTLYAQSTAAGIGFANGSGLAVSAANEGRLRYNTTGQKAQLSFNTAAYFDVATYAAALTTGSVVFANGSNQLAQDNARLIWDDTNKNLSIVSNHATNGVLFLRSSVATGPSAFGTNDSSGTFKSYWGWFNATYGFTYLRSHHGVLCFDDSSFIVGGSAAKAIEVGVVSGSAFLEMASGGSAAVSAANTGRLIYTTTGQKAQLSFNAAGFFDVATYAAALTTGSVPFANASNQLAQDNANLFWDNTNKRLGIGLTAPVYAFHVKNPNTAQATGRVESSHTGGYAALEYIDSSTALQLSLGYGNSAVAVAYLQSVCFLYSGTSKNIVLANPTKVEHSFGVTSGSAYLQMAVGASAGVSAANTARIRYNEGTGKLQVSINTAAYVDLH